ncbi:MAG: Ribosomally synthesized peptide [Chloroflexota bacterium]|jgi:hypothetical protein|nr:Ribosomally synthesized peptide [Chloroflexota bacterium]
MASKNLGAVIQRAISDGAFRRQLQSDPAAALRGFNLTADEAAAIRSGDSSKLMSLGVDQRMSKAFSVGGLIGTTRGAVSDLGTGGGQGVHAALADDANSGAREGIVGDPTSSGRAGLADPTTGGARAIHDSEPADLRGAVTTGEAGNVRAIHDSEPADLRGAVTTGEAGNVRAIHDSEPTDIRGAVSTDALSGTRAVHDSEPYAGNAALSDDAAAANAGRGGSLAGDMHQAASGGEGSGTAMIAADDNYSVASAMADAGTADSVRAINDVAPFEGNVNAAATSGSEFLGGDARLDPGTDSAHAFNPADSADVQRELLDAGHGDALGNIGGGGNTSS